MSSEPLTNVTVRDLLIEHMDDRPVTLTLPNRHDMEMPHGARIVLSQRRRLIASMLARNYLTTRVCEDGVGMETVITPRGRAALSAALADWSDALVRAYPDRFPATLWCEKSTKEKYNVVG